MISFLNGPAPQAAKKVLLRAYHSTSPCTAMTYHDAWQPKDKFMVKLLRNRSLKSNLSHFKSCSNKFKIDLTFPKHLEHWFPSKIGVQVFFTKKKTTCSTWKACPLRYVSLVSIAATEVGFQKGGRKPWTTFRTWACGIRVPPWMNQFTSCHHKPLR